MLAAVVDLDDGHFVFVGDGKRVGIRDDDGRVGEVLAKGFFDDRGDLLGDRFGVTLVVVEGKKEQGPDDDATHGCMKVVKGSSSHVALRFAIAWLE